MNDEEINRAIAEHLGWKPTTDGGICWTDDGEAIITPPNYCGDLNAMHEAEKTLENHQLWMMTYALAGIVHVDTPIAHATSYQRAEAFLRTVGKWRGKE
jgi:hypothetical protein